MNYKQSFLKAAIFIAIVLGLVWPIFGYILVVIYSIIVTWLLIFFCEWEVSYVKGRRPTPVIISITPRK